MRYTDPELRDRLAAEYVLGTMPVRARRRFEQLMAAEPEIALAVTQWSARFAPLDAATSPETPPARVWRAIARRIPETGDQPTSGRSWLDALALWRGLTAAALAALAAVVIYFTLAWNPPATTVVAVLSDQAGAPAWVAVRGPRAGEVSVSATGPVARQPGRSLELWGIAGAGKPRWLGLLPGARDRALVVASDRLPPVGGVLAISREPENGSPTGLPTGPVIYQGKLVASP